MSRKAELSVKADSENHSEGSSNMSRLQLVL